MFGRPFYPYLLACLLALLPGACSEPGSLRIGSNRWPGYEPLYLARDRQAFQREEVHLVELPSSSDVMQYLRNGNLDGGMLTLDETLTLITDGVPLRVVLVMDVSNGADTLLAQPEIQDLAGLKGRRIGVELSALGALMLESILEKTGLRSDQVTLVPLTIDQQEAAFRARRVDAVITFDPTRSRLLAEGAVELFSSRKIPGRIVDVLAIRQDALTEHAAQLRRLLAGYFEARRFMAERPRLAASQMAPRLGMDEAGLRQAFQGLTLPDLTDNHRWLEGAQPRLLDSAKRLADLMLRHRLIDHPPSLEGLTDGRYLP